MWATEKTRTHDFSHRLPHCSGWLLIDWDELLVLYCNWCLHSFAQNESTNDSTGFLYLITPHPSTIPPSTLQCCHKYVEKGKWQVLSFSFLFLFFFFSVSGCCFTVGSSWLRGPARHTGKQRYWARAREKLCPGSMTHLRVGPHYCKSPADSEQAWDEMGTGSVQNYWSPKIKFLLLVSPRCSGPIRYAYNASP